ncbi:LysR family transcriptional regulator [Mesorhizobium sp. B2-3-5]|uniref:LysR family transcriptional regulator n=1 Tax=Mesorhizobium sp. B2-3-5 TaxID=2589958 RepID=UPI0011261520|nr:LysR family transcriptional regulator [Mesorhizobium sp. B2-3-5]TPM24605.1 LysR family transcriptional regulator [Mesorhizobium sp. B2-3-5]
MNRLSAMEAFVRVMETGSFSGAARQLRIGQPAVSKAVAQIEDRLGVRLLLRTTHGLTPTESGQSFYDHAKRAIEEAEEAELAARGAGAALSGRLRVCAAVTFARLHVIPRLKAFLDQHPALEVDVVLDDRNVDLVEAGIDVALRMGSLTDSSLTARKIGQARRLVIGTPAYFKEAGTPKTPSDLADHESIIYDQRGGGTAWTFRQGAAEIAITLKGRVRVTAAEGVREAVLGGLGLTVSSEWMFSPELRSCGVLAVLEDWSLPAMDLWAVFPTGRQASAKARAFATFIEGCISGESISDEETIAAE